ncbi:hypothetical protein EPA93_08950 [Ktedonosporobacter rubrisoli]|uniref:Uncharacterized protein n=1 Tax=Ktedonosporobacter rubrisoli TaxID=2509675 RepID=A0A4P6JLM4_KTERU|nr:hypothetical protein [Ktedonosporobacter rubrisoli]QBD76129.1 hypothetical protein EPA93_08950 [Ktedonosporobacter rubrisoli]
MDYTAMALTAMCQAHSLLDMHTGGGGRLTQLFARQPVAIMRPAGVRNKALDTVIALKEQNC